MVRLLELLVNCGWLLLPLVVVGAFIVAVTLERLSTLRREPRAALPVVQALHQAYRDGGAPALLAEAEAQGPTVAAVVRVVADTRDHNSEAVSETLDAVDRRLDGPLTLLRVVSDLTPLLGCAVSLISLSSVNRLVASPDHARIQSIYSHALVVTAAGLLLALAGRLAVLMLERRRLATLLALRTVANEARELLRPSEAAL
ncbi:MAG: MotA/TolQ/ExbB proton channel family protein [Armatimonadetes bacterium]|nr:MotA/TolQ/ExbB proton channel family protein [Armatimonadota bacterium]